MRDVTVTKAWSGPYIFSLTEASRLFQCWTRASRLDDPKVTSGLLLIRRFTNRLKVSMLMVPFHYSKKTLAKNQPREEIIRQSDEGSAQMF